MSIFLLSCSLEWDKIINPELPHWVTHFEVPLLTNILSVEELMSNVEDTSINQILYSSITNGDSTLYAFQDTISEEPKIISFNSNVKPFSEKTVTELGPIELANIPETETPPFKLGEINPNLSSINGQNTTIPSFTIQAIEKSFEFSDFQEATFKSGNLIIEVENNLPIDLNNINVKLKKNDGIYIDSTYISEVPSGESRQGIIDLNSNTLYQNIFIEVDGNSPGSNSNNILINTLDYFIIKISGNNLKVRNAISKIPEQSSPLEGTGTMAIPESDNRISKAVFKKAKLKISIINNLDLLSELTLEIPGIQNQNNNSPPMLINLPRNSSIDTTFDLKSNYMVLYSGNDFNEFLSYPQSISYSYNVSLESPADFRSVSETDKIDVSFYFYGSDSDSSITFSQITGKIPEKGEDIGPINQSPPDMPEDMDNFLLLDKYVDMILQLKTNSSGIPLILNMTIKAEAEDSLLLTTLIENWDISKQGTMIPIPQAAEIINKKPTTITITGSAIVGSETQFTTIDVVDEISMESNFIINIPFVFTLDSSSMIEQPPEFINPNQFDGLPISFDDIELMELFINYDNQLGFGADISILMAPDTNYFSDTSSIIPDTLITSFFIENNTQNSDTIALNTEQIKLLTDSTFLKTTINMFGDEIFFISTDSLIIKISAAIDYYINQPDSSISDSINTNNGY